MRLVFLADASRAIGSGHVMRSSAIAEEAISQGIDCVFVGSISNVGWLQERVASLGFSKIVRLDEFISEPDSDVLILDSYALELDHFFIQSKCWHKIIKIADSFTPEYFADLVIHPGLESSWYQGDATKFLSGPKYVPLRKSIRKNSHEIRQRVEQILVFGGGTDSFNFALSMANILRQLNGFTSVTFFSNDKLRIQNLDTRFTVCDFGSQLDSAIDSADLVFTTASTSSLEVIARGIPVGIASAVPNQTEFYLAIGQYGIATHVGDRVSTGDWILDKNEIEKLIHDFLYRLDLVNRGVGVIDFEGAARIVDAIIGLVV
jgi:spore coat polysaccharide biosynthesis predicted glycosyltransferase SpsG